MCLTASRYCSVVVCPCRYASRSLSSRLSSSRYFGRRRGGEAPCLACRSVSSVKVCSRLSESSSLYTFGCTSPTVLFSRLCQLSTWLFVLTFDWNTFHMRTGNCPLSHVGSKYATNRWMAALFATSGSLQRAVKAGRTATTGRNGSAIILWMNLKQ